MLCRDIYKAALGKLSEKADSARNADYAERAPYILANVVSDLRTLDDFYRESHGLPKAPELPGTEVCLPLTDPFPLADRFAGAVIEYLASALILRQNSELSDAFFSRFSHAVTAITAEIPAEKQRILDKYR